MTNHEELFRCLSDIEQVKIDAEKEIIGMGLLALAAISKLHATGEDITDLKRKWEEYSGRKYEAS